MRANETTVTELDAGVSWVLLQHTAPRGALPPRLHVGWVAFHLCRPRLVFFFSFWSPPKEYQNSRKALALAQGLSPHRPQALNQPEFQVLDIPPTL